MLINVLLGLIFLALVVYLGLQVYDKTKSPGRIAAEELEQERRRRERRMDNLRRIREHVDERAVRIENAVGEVVRTLGEGSGVDYERDGRTTYVQAGDTQYAAEFLLPEYDLDVKNLDVESYSDKYGKYVLHGDDGKYEYESLDELVRYLARTLARSVSERRSD
jgi:hypothetical protein